MKVVQIFKECGNMGKILPEYLSYWTTEKVRSEGVDVIANTDVVSVGSGRDEEVIMNLSNGQKVTAQYVIVAIGAAPNTDLAEVSDLEIDPDFGGYLVNTELQARSNLYIVSV